MLFYLIYLAAVAGFILLRNNYNLEGHGLVCEDFLGCVLLHFTDGFRKDGGIAESLIVHDPNSFWSRQHGAVDGFYVFRALFDVFYFLLVVVILLGVIQGIIVDSFGSFRDERESLRIAVRKQCFICGISANRLTTEADGMDKHIKRDHHAFMYVYYIDYIQSKDPTERTGLESYVYRLYKEGNYTFLPEDDCLSVRNRKSKLRTEHRAKNRLERSRAELAEELASVHEELSGLKDMMSEVFQRNHHGHSSLAHSGLGRRGRIPSFGVPSPGRHIYRDAYHDTSVHNESHEGALSQEDLGVVQESKEENDSTTPRRR